MGLLDSTKGELDLMKAMSFLKNRGVPCCARIAGQFKRKDYEEKFISIRKDLSLEADVEYLGILQGNEKIAAFQWADVFCFPSFFSSESFGLVLIEAMQFMLPIVATRWRGIPDLVKDGFNGYLVDINMPEKIADKLNVLAKDQELRIQMGKNGRKRYEAEYTLEKHLQRMELALSEI